MALLSAPRRAALATVGSALLLVASASAQTSARVEGRAVDPAGSPIRNAVIRLVSDPTSHTSTRPWRYTLLADSLGKFSQGGLAPGAYLVMLFSGNKAERVLHTVFLRADGTTVLDFGQSSNEPAKHSPSGRDTLATRVSSRMSALGR